MVKAQSHF